LARTEHEGHVRYAAPQAFARLRLLSGMVYANRPWRLAAGMSRVMMATFASGAVSLAYPTIWQLSATMGPWRLSVTTVLSTAAMVAWLVVNHRLWERPDSPSQRDRAALYNTSTVITLTIGVVVLHASSFVLLLLTAFWTLPPQMLEQNLGHPVGAADYLRLVWLVAAVATLGARWDRALKTTVSCARRPTEFDSGRDSTTPTTPPQNDQAAIASFNRAFASGTSSGPERQVFRRHATIAGLQSWHTPTDEPANTPAAIRTNSQSGNPFAVCWGSSHTQAQQRFWVSATRFL
jgi:hypothetical protein